MPTATSISGYTFINNGALTTTFTAPASCSTDFLTMVAYKSYPLNPVWADDCGWMPQADCNPSGSVLRPLLTSVQAGNPKAGQFMVYQSPGVVCPSGWTTAGEAAKINPTSTRISGAFNVSDESSGPPFPQFVPYMDVFIDALGPSETALACCPSSYTATWGACFSKIPSSVFSPTRGCQRIIPPGDIGSINVTRTVSGEAITEVELTITATTPLTTETISFATLEASRYGGLVGLAQLGPAFLVYQASDTSTGSKASDTSTAPNPSKTSSAARVGASGNKLGVAVAISCAAIILTGLLV